MKLKIFTLSAALLMAAAGMTAQTSVDAWKISDLTTGRDGSRFFVNMTIDPHNLKRSVNSRVELFPVVWSADSTQRVELPAVTVAGTNMYYSTMRNGTPEQLKALYRAGRGNAIRYENSVPYQTWMENCTVGVEARQTGCCGAPKGDELIPVAVVEKQVFEPDFIYRAPLDTAEKRFDLKGRARVRFIVNKTNIDWSYANNYVELDSILRTVNVVKDNPDANVDSIILTGYASPEGPYLNNVRLAKGRTEVIKEYVRKNATFPADVYHTSSVPEDWQGLRDWLVTCNLPDRQKMIEFIDDPTIPLPQKNDLFRSRFPKDYPFILANVYPPLRHTDYRITYTVRKYLNVDEIRQVFATRPYNLSLNELFMLANSYEPGSRDYDKVFNVAVSLYPDDVTANLNAANSAMNRGEWEQAERYLDNVAGDAYADYGKGVLMAMQKRYAEAIPFLQKAVDGGVAEARKALEEVRKCMNVTNGVRYLNPNK